MTNKKTEMQDIDDTFYSWWYGEEGKTWPAKIVYQTVNRGTARALFAEGWVQAEKHFAQQQDDEED